MVKPPRIRHSKTTDEPVTIELGKDDVSRLPSDKDKTSEKAADTVGAKAASASDGKPAATATPNPAAAEPAKHAASATGASSASAGTSTGSAGASTSSSATVKTGKQDSAAASATPSAFGRDPKPATPQPPAAKIPARSGTGGALLGGLVGGAIVLAAATGAYYAGVIPAGDQPAAQDESGLASLRSEIGALRSELSELRTAQAAEQPDDGQAGLDAARAQIEAMGVLVEETRAQLAQLRSSVEAGAQDGALAGRLDTIEQRLDQVAQPGADDQMSAEIAALKQALSAADESARNAGSAASSAAERIDALEQTVSQLSTKLAEQAERPGAALAIAASALKAAIDRGQPFMTELETYAAVAPDAPEIARLREMAARGVPTRAAIEARSAEAAVAMIAAARGETQASGLVDRLWASAQSLVNVRPIGNVEGTDVPAVTARIENALKSGDYSAALTEYESLPPAAKAAGESLAADIRARQAADEIVGKALADALRA